MLVAVYRGQVQGRGLRERRVETSTHVAGFPCSCGESIPGVVRHMRRVWERVVAAVIGLVVTSKKVRSK